MFVAEDSVAEVSPLIDAFVIRNRVEFESQNKCGHYSCADHSIAFQKEDLEMATLARCLALCGAS
jgi:hypothetical protein